MIPLLARIIFFAAVICVVTLFTFGSHPIQIETNLNDLNPGKASNPGLNIATNALSEDIGQRFTIVVRGVDKEAVKNAYEQLQTQLDQIESLLVLSTDSTQNSYLSALSPYRFHLLSDTQRQALYESDIDHLANEALRKLYQLGDGVRLIPFEHDPLGWFSDYLLTRLDRFNLAGETSTENTESDSVSSSQFESFTVTISDYPENMAEQETLYQTINDIASQIGETFNVTVLHSGMFFFAVDSAQSAKDDIQLIAIGSIIGVLLLMLLVFRSLLPLCLSLGSIAIGVSFGILISTLVFGSIHILTIVFGASLIGIVVDYSLHYCYHSLSCDDNANRIKTHKGSLHRAMLLSAVTSIIGYGALGLSDLVLLKKVALFSCSGLLMAWLGVMVLGPWMTRRPIAARQAFLMGVINAFQNIFARHPGKLISSGVLLACLGGLYLCIANVNINDDPRLFFQVSPALLTQEQEVASLTQVYEPGRYLVVEGNTSTQIYQGLEAYYDKLGSQSNQVTSVLDWAPAPGAQQQDYALQKILYMDNGVIDTFYQRLGLGRSQSQSIKTAYAEAQHRVLDFPVLLKELSFLPPLWIEHGATIYSFVLIKKNSDLDKAVTASEGIANIQYINTLAIATEVLQVQRVTGAKLLLVAYALIAVMLALNYRRVSAILLVLIPLCASIITLSVLAAIGQPITVFHIMALFLVLGLGMDYIIFAKEMANRQAITQQAILLSAATSLLSFGLLAFSSMPIVQAFGSTILIGNGINFIAAISLFSKQSIQ